MPELVTMEELCSELVLVTDYVDPICHNNKNYRKMLGHCKETYVYHTTDAGGEKVLIFIPSVDNGASDVFVPISKTSHVDNLLILMGDKEIYEFLSFSMDSEQWESFLKKIAGALISAG